MCIYVKNGTILISYSLHSPVEMPIETSISIVAIKSMEFRGQHMHFTTLNLEMAVSF